MDDLIKSAQEAYKQKEYDSALSIYMKVIVLNLPDITRLNILHNLIEIYYIKSDFSSLIECADEYFILLKDVGLSESEDAERVTELLKKTEERKRELITEEQNRPILKLNLTAIGYWESKEEPDFPNPREFQDPTWDETEKKLVIQHLKNGIPIIYSRGFSWYRFHCGEKNMGTKCLTDGLYLFPEKLTHYLEKHDVRLPEKFIQHVKQQTPINTKNKFQLEKIDYHWWKNLKRNKRKGFINRIGQMFNKK